MNILIIKMRLETGLPFVSVPRLSEQRLTGKLCNINREESVTHFTLALSSMTRGQREDDS